VCLHVDFVILLTKLVGMLQSCEDSARGVGPADLKTHWHARHRHARWGFKGFNETEASCQGMCLLHP